MLKPNVPRGRKKLSAAARYFVVTVLSIGLVALSPGATSWVTAQAVDDELETALTRLDSLNTTMQSVRSSIDRSQFDVEDLGLDLAFEDAEAILAYVQDRIAFEPYRGVLRGAEGALRSSAGNSFDQALLLATLLSLAGYESRIQVGTISPDQAAALVAGAFVAPTVSENGLEAAIAALDELAALTAGPDAVGSEAWIATLNDDAENLQLLDETVDRLVGALGPGGLGGEATAEVEAILDEAREYAFVEYRLGDPEEWTAAHPAWRSGQPPSEVAIVETIDGAVPEKYLHRVRFEAFIERRIGDKLEIKPLMSAWERPVANAADRAFTFAVLPLGGTALVEALGNPLDLDPLTFDLEATVDASDFYVPMFDGKPAPGAVAFDSAGLAAPLEAATNPAAGTFKNVARGFGQAAGALGALGGGPADLEILALTGYWLQTTLISPSGEEHVERRYMLDRIGTERREAGEVAPNAPLEVHDLFTSITWSVHSGSISDAWLLDLTVQRLLDLRPVVERLITDIVTGRETSPEEIAGMLANVEEDGVPLAQLEHAGVIRSFDHDAGVYADSDAELVADRGDEAIMFRPSPVVLAIERGYDSLDGVDGSVARLVTDIQANPRRALRQADDGSIEIAQTAAVRAGVWETIAERSFALSAAGTIGLLTLESAVDALASDASPPIVVSDRAALEDLGSMISPEQAAVIRRDLDRGYVAVLPGTISGEVAASWWRIDPATGETLGIGDGGRGQTMVEYLVGKGLSLTAAKVAAGIVYAAILYPQCVLIGGTIRAFAGSPSLPVRSCGVALVGIVMGGPTMVGVYAFTFVMYLNTALDIAGVEDIGL